MTPMQMAQAIYDNKQPAEHDIEDHEKELLIIEAHILADFNPLWQAAEIANNYTEIAKRPFPEKALIELQTKLKDAVTDALETASLNY